MKRTLLLFFVLVFTAAKSQVVFCPPGAEWHYLFLENNLSQYPSFDNEKISYVRDSLLNGDLVKVLIHKRYVKNFNNNFSAAITLLKQVGDTIFFRNSRTDNAWELLYNFNVAVSASWVPVKGLASPQYTTVVLEKNDTTINGHLLKKLKVEVRSPWYEPGEWSDTVTIVERLGADKFLFYFLWKGDVSDGDSFFQPLCYEDDSLGVVKYSAYPCDYRNSVGLAELKGVDEFEVYPNPVGEILQIKGVKLAGGEFRVQGVDGRDMSDHISRQSGSEISVQQLPPGVYFLLISDENNLFVAKKFVKL